MSFYTERKQNNFPLRQFIKIYMGMETLEKIKQLRK